MRKFFDEFKAFINRGSLIDLAIGIIIGSSFGKIVSSFVNDLLMPPLGVIIGGVDFKDIQIVLKKATETDAEVTIRIGLFLNTAIDFAIIAFCCFLIIKTIKKLVKKEEPKKVEKISKEIELLSEIRDLLKSK